MSIKDFIVAVVIVKEAKILLIQEAEAHCYGKWNLPSGHVKFGESIIKAAVRETKEETGYDIEPKSILFIQSYISDTKKHYLKFVILSSIIGGSESYNKAEVLDLKWFSFEEIEHMNDQLRKPKTLEEVLTALRKQSTYPLEILHDPA